MREMGKQQLFKHLLSWQLPSKTDSKEGFHLETFMVIDKLEYSGLPTFFKGTTGGQF